MLFARMLRAARFDRTLYDELRADPVALAQALTVLLLAFLALVIGAVLFVTLGGGSRASLGFALVDPMALWLFPALSLFFLGGLTRAKDPALGSDRDLLITIGFAASPGLLWLIPHPMAVVTVWGWVMASMVIAAKVMLRVSLFRAVVFVLPGLMVYWLMMAALGLLLGAG